MTTCILEALNQVNGARGAQGGPKVITADMIDNEEDPVKLAKMTEELGSKL